MFNWGQNMPLPFPRKFAKMQVLNIVVPKFCIDLFTFFKIVVLKACSYSKPISNFKHLQERSFLRDLQFLEELFPSLYY